MIKIMFFITVVFFTGCTQMVTAPISIAGSVAGAAIDVTGSAIGATVDIVSDDEEEDK